MSSEPAASLPPRSPVRALAAALLAIGPLLVVPIAAAIVSLVAGWRFPVQIGDTAWLTQRVADVWSTDPPLIGMPSTLGGGELATHHPGPVQFYWLAPWWQLFGHRGIAVGSAAAAAVALTWIGRAASTLPSAGIHAAVAVQVAVAVGALTISPELFADPWNPFAALPWAVLFVVSAARVHLGDRRGWLGVAVGVSVAVQLHAGYLPWAALMLVALGVATWRRASLDQEIPPASPPARARWVAPVAVSGVLWFPPLVDLLFGIHNPVLLLRAALTGDGADTGPGAVAVAASAALSPLHRAHDAVWIVPDLHTAELLTLVSAVAAIAATWWVSPRERWTRAVLTWSGVGVGVWLVVAARAPLADGLLAHSYVRPLWPLGALLWVAVAAEWWARRPARLAGSWWVPALVLVLWAVVTPRGYVGIDPASRTRGGEVVAALATVPAPVDGLTLHARGPVGSTWIAPSITAALDHRGIPNGIGTHPEWDHPGMSRRPLPLPGTTCEWWVGTDVDLAAAGIGGNGSGSGNGSELVVEARRGTAAEQERLATLERLMIARFASLEPSRLARHRSEHGGDPIGDRTVGDLVRTGAFADLVVAGLLERATLRDPDVADYVERSYLDHPAWADVVVRSRSCAQGGPP